MRPDLHAFSPRLGIAWRPWEKRARSSAEDIAFSTAPSAYSQLGTHLATQPPFSTTLSLTTSSADAADARRTVFRYCLRRSFPTPSASIRISNSAYAQTWNFAVQKALPHGLLMELEYIGTKGTDLRCGGAAEPPAAGILAAQRPGTLQIPNATGFTYETSAGEFHLSTPGRCGSRDALRRGISAVLLYTRSKSIDDASSFSGIGRNGGAISSII